MRHCVPSLFALVLALVPDAASACDVAPSSGSAEPSLVGYPRPGAEAVPIDVVPVYESPLDDATPLTAARASLTSGAGEVALQVRRSEQGFLEFVPKSRLTPSTPYTLRVSWTLEGTSRPEDVVQFSTGSAAFNGSMELPALRAAAAAGTDCSAAQREEVCVSLPDEGVYVADLGGHHILHLGSLGIGSSTQASVTGGVDKGRGPALLGVECLRIRLRAPGGQLGPAREICADEIDVRDLDQEGASWAETQCTQQGLRVGALLIEPPAPAEADDASCSTHPWRATSRVSIAAMALMLAASLLARRSGLGQRQQFARQRGRS